MLLKPDWLVESGIGNLVQIITKNRLMSKVMNQQNPALINFLTLSAFICLSAYISAICLNTLPLSAAVAAVVVRRRLKRDGKCGIADGILKEFEQKCAAAKLKQVADATTMGMHAGLTSEGGSK